ncbi:aminotransferase class III-fold pyridoxal phosphate-dependent enzyme [Streptomyces sp. SID8382]|uniref:aspartate aminotransferase family protein n=1 Tax=Streptomyces malaysiensis TaxID=92644 RepID=UPI000C2B8D59|nr:aspartate aminotransferase family protein [Streptomyces sp. M56]AUA16733.1 Glutamate-1-semialdehyde 2,1-aminomutase [Streptomyces sp. M56]MYX62800.1 aminotransferase class III-fold pyridoxal phosphate-dependent enzyme [Streptomyces sp. SID8382]
MNVKTFAGSEKYMRRAHQVIPKGVNSSRRAVLRPTPLAFTSALGSRITDVDGNEYVDYVAGYGPMLLGHQPPRVIEAVRTQLTAGVLYGGQHQAEAELAERIVRMVPGAQMVLLNVTGSEAVQAALRMARAATGRRKTVKFKGHYHGWIDPVTANGPGSPAGTGPAPRPAIAADHHLVGPEILICPWNDPEALADLLGRHGADVAAVIMEPVAVNGGNLWADEGYLATARRLCDQHGCLLVFDEVVTGFRLAPGGAQQRTGVTPDLTVLAKALGAGFPISAVAGRAEVMRIAEEIGHAGTYNGNATSVVAANAALDVLESDQDSLYPRLERLTNELADGIERLAARHGAPLQALRARALIRLHWGAPTPVRTYADTLAGRTEPLRHLSEHLIRSGVHARDTGLWYVSAAHTDDDVDRTLAAVDQALAAVSRQPVGNTG